VAIHPTAIVHPGAEIAPDVEVGPYCVIEPGARIGSGTTLQAHVFVGRGTSIGKANEIHIGAVLGNIPQDKKFRGEPSRVEIGNRNIFREYCQIHRGSTEGSATRIGDDNLFMAMCHVAHDCVIGNGAIFGSSILLAGHITVEDRVVISGHVAIHQFTTIGTLAMIGGLSAVTRDIPPFLLATGQRPCRVYGPNTVGLRRAGLPPERRFAIRRAYRLLYRSNLTVPEALGRLEDLASTAEIAHLIEFIRSSRRGIETAGPARRTRVESASDPEVTARPDPLL
jgi:UDP-N-acetylglucosamine acyltransferase